MKKQTINKIIEIADSDKTAIEMILSSCVDYGSEAGALLSVKKFPKVAEMIINYFKEKNIQSTRRCTRTAGKNPPAAGELRRYL